MKQFLKWWKKNVFKILVFFSLFVLFICFLTSDGEGSYSKEIPQFHIDPVYSYQPKNKPFVSESKGQQICRVYLEKTFKRPFPSVRPDFLKNVITGKPLEIDCCNFDLMLGVEYNGRQHYEYTPGMHKNKEAFQTQQYRDHMKKELCEKNNLTLITVPYTIPDQSIENFLYEELNKKGFLK